MQPALIFYDDDKDSFWAVAAEEKGATESMVKYGVGIIDESGYIGEKITFKSDQEPSIVALKHAVSAARIGETVPIESPVRSSKANGMMENAVKIWQGQLRTIKHYVETRVAKTIEPGSALFTWLIPFCADILNKFRIGSDGRTAYERITSHSCKVAQIGFAEIVDFKLETDKNNRLKADSEFNVGIFLGYAWRSTEYLVASKGIVFKCRTVRRRADDVAYDAEMINELSVRYDEYTLKGAKTSLHVSFPKGTGGVAPAPTPTRGPGIVPRRIYLMPGDVSKHGFTQGCPGCTYAQNGLGPKRNHTDDCRRRLDREIGKDSLDNRGEKVKERQDHFIAQQVEEN